MTSRDRILARRTQFVAAAVALAGCRDPEPSAPRSAADPPSTTSAASVALAGPPHDAGTDAQPVDTDQDGVPDERDKCPDLPGTVLREGCPSVCLSIVLPSEITVTHKIYFANKSSTLRPESLQILDEIALVLKANEALEFEVRGHADVGEAKGIGEARARAVRDALVSRGVDGKRLTVRDLGTTAPAEKVAHERNRRVEFVAAP